MLSAMTWTFCATLSAVWFVTLTSGGGVVRIPITKFTCSGKPNGYYADMETGCQVYHMCDSLGRQFSYTCPNTTLFQQRMLVCDHWYMVNCSKSEKDYSANLLIGQRDKPFVRDDEMRFHTPRPDILSVPPNSNYFEGLKEAESKFPIHPSNSIVGAPDSFTDDENELDSGKHQYRPPSSWSTGTGVRPQRPTQQKPVKPNRHNNDEEEEGLAGAESQEAGPTVHTVRDTPSTHRPTSRPNTNIRPNSNIRPPSQDLSPPIQSATDGSEEMQIDARMKEEDTVVKFINRFDPNSPDPVKTPMTTQEIIGINRQLPQGAATSAEEERQPRRQKLSGNNGNTLDSSNKNVFTQSRFNSVNEKSNTRHEVKPTTSSFPTIPTPAADLLPPNEETHTPQTTTVGPPIYYEWKWAVPAFDLELPNQSNITTNFTDDTDKNDRSPFSSVTRPTPSEIAVTNSNTEYNISSYLVPDYVFPLDTSHPGYDSQGAKSSFQVEVAKPGKSYGENPDCPHCHPAYLTPGTCEPCIVKR